MSDEQTRVTFLGTASVVPEGGHDTASFLIDGRQLVDTGWYAAIKMKLYDHDPTNLDHVILTHCHHDHYMGLPQILYLRAAHRRDRPPLKIIGPAEDLKRVVDLATRFLQPDRFPGLGLGIELCPLMPGDTFETSDFRLDACRALHPVPALCYRYRDHRTGAELAFTGDTAPYPPIVEHVRGVSLLIHEASYCAWPSRPNDNRSLHSGAPDAARVAAEAGIGRLALIHGALAKQAEAVAAAQAIFPDTFWPEDGEVVSVGAA